MNPLQILQIMFPILFLSALGYLYARLRGAEPQVVSDMIIYLSIPALFFNSFYKQKLIISELPVIFLTIALVMAATLITILLLKKIFRWPVGIYLPSIFMNSAFVGFPVVLLAYGELGLSRAVAYDFFNGLFIFTLGVYIISRRQDRFDLFKMPFLYAALLGLGLNLLNIYLPLFLQKSIQMLGGTTIPLALLMLGFRLGATPIRSFTYPLLASFFRMGMGIAVACFLVWALKVEASLAKVLIVMSALPSAFMNLVLAEKYKTDVELVASSIAVCTLLSVIVLPLLLWILK